jgi:hypothetical protein
LNPADPAFVAAFKDANLGAGALIFCRIGRPFLGLTNIAILQQARAFSKEKNCAIFNLL